MRRRFVGLLTSVFVAGGCVAALPPGESTTATLTSEPSPTAPQASVAATIEPTTEPQPTLVSFPTDVASVDLPATLAGISWAAMQVEFPPDGARIGHLYGGLMGSSPTILVDVTNPTGYPNPVASGDLVAVIEDSDADHARVRVWHAAAGALVADLAVDGRVPTIVLDPVRSFVYAAAPQVAGGVEIRRRSFDGVTDDLLLELDARFTPDGIPTERYGLLLGPDGELIVEACADVDGCRLWEIPPTAATAPEPRTLPGDPPIVCQLVGATREWLVVQDDAACWADTGDAELPVRAIRRSDGQSHIVTTDHVGVGRLIEVGDRTWLVGADGIVIGNHVDIVRYDVLTGARIIVQRDLPATPDGQITIVSPTVLPGTWVLLVPIFVDTTGLPDFPARFLDIESGETIELPIGTFGWY